VHISAKYTIILWCTRLHVYIRTSLVLNVCSRRLPTIMTSLITSEWLNIGWFSFGHFSSTPTSILNLTISSESQYNDDSNDISSVLKYSQFFTHESNTFLAKIRRSSYYVITSPRVIACCCERRSQNIGRTQCTFLYISPQTPFRFWTRLCREKAKKMTFSMMYCPYGNFLNFSHTSRIYFY